MLAVIAFMATGMKANAANDLTVGYCYGEDPKNCPAVYDDENAEVSAAVYIPASYAQTLKGNKVTKVNACVYMRINANNLRVWVRESLDGENLGEALIEKYTSIKTGYNALELDKPYEIGDKGFYMGITFSQKKACRMIDALPMGGTGTLFVKAPGADWADMSAEGTLCVEGILGNDIQPEYDVRLVSAQVSPYYIISQKELTGSLSVRNIGSKKVTGLTVEVTPDGLPSLTQEIACNIAPNSAAEVKFNVSPNITSLSPGSYKVGVKIASLADGQDADMESNEIAEAGEFKVINSAFPRRVLVEEFTTEKCPNCPRVANFLHTILEMPKYERVEAICHHSGYYTDAFTIPADNKYVWFYNAGGSTYAPAMMIDRVNLEDNSPVFLPSSQAYVQEYLDQRLAVPSFAMSTVDFDVPGEKDKTIKVTVRAERSAKVLEDNAILTIYFVEDNVKPSSGGQSGAASGFLHQHVTRAVNDTWGVPIVWGEDNTFTTECTFNLMNYKRQDLKVVAVISHYNSSNPNDCEVENVNFRRLDGTPDGDVSGVEPVIIAEPATVIGIYDINGRRLNEYGKGLNIVVYSDGTSRKVMINK